MLSRSFNEYVSGAVKIGVGLGVISILARWISGNTIFASPDALVKYGIIGGIGYAFIGALALLIFAWFGKRARLQFPEGLTIGDYLRYKLPPFGYWVMVVLIIIVSMEGIIIQGMAAGVLLKTLFGIPASLGLLLFFLVAVLYAGIGGLNFIQRFALVQVIFMLASAILIPLYFFIGQGVLPIYEGIRLYHPYLLVINNHDALVFILASSFICFGRIFIDPSTWQRLYLLEEKKIIPTFLLSGLLWATISLVFFSLIMIALYDGLFTDISSLLIDLINKINLSFLLFIFAFCSIGAVISVFGAQFHALISFVVANIYQIIKPEANNRDKIKMAYQFSIILGIISYLITLYFSSAVLNLLFFFGIIYAALIVPLIMIVLWRKEVGNIAPISMVIGLAAGFISQPHVGNLGAIWVSSGSSSMIITVYCCRALFHKFLQKK